MKKTTVDQTIDGMRVVAVLEGTMVRVLTDLAGPLTEVGVGEWDGRQFQCAAWLGRDQFHADMVHAAIQHGLAASRRAPARRASTA